MRKRAAQLTPSCRTVLLALVPLVTTSSCAAGSASRPDAGDDSTPVDAAEESTFSDADEDSATRDAADGAASRDGVAEKRCGDSPTKYFSALNEEMLAKFADCTVLVGHFQEDSVRDLMDLAALSNVRRVEGSINIFRSPGS
jgi:hypothetical protein